MERAIAVNINLMQEIKQETFRKERGKLLSFIRGKVSNAEEAEDILQDVFYQFVAGFESIESLDRVTSWLYSVARNKIIDRYRRDAARPKKAKPVSISVFFILIRKSKSTKFSLCNRGAKLANYDRIKEF